MSAVCGDIGMGVGRCWAGGLLERGRGGLGCVRGGSGVIPARPIMMRVGSSSASSVSVGSGRAGGRSVLRMDGTGPRLTGARAARMGGRGGLGLPPFTATA